MNDIVSAPLFAPALQLAGIESGATAAAAKARALVEARYFMALRNPRNWDQVRQDLLKECRRPSFAHNKSALYLKPIGDGVEGLGIRFVEVGIRCMRNVSVETEMVFEDDSKEIHRIEVVDLESNVPLGSEIPVQKAVERSRPADDGTFLAVRKNSWGKNVYLVPARGDDLLNIRGALISKAMRTLGLRLIPGYLQDEAIEIIKAIRLDAAAKDPDAERRKILDAFAEINVRATDLADYLEHDIAACSPAEIVKLRGLYGAIRDGEATWATVLENKASQAGAPTPPAPKSNALPAMGADQFDKDKAAWKSLVQGGNKTAEQLLAMLGTKHALSDEQQAEIKGWEDFSGARAAQEGQGA